MRKRLQFLYVCLLPAFGFSQLMIPDLTKPVLASTDSSEVVRQFSSSITETNKVLLRWTCSNLIHTDFFTVERSTNGKPFEAISVLKAHETLEVIEWSDEAPVRGRNLYRIRYADREGRLFHSKALSAVIVGDVSFKFYPNPVDNILIIRSEMPVEASISDGAGKIRIPSVKVHGLYTMNVSNLEKGIYFLRVINKLTNIITQETLYKN